MNLSRKLNNYGLTFAELLVSSILIGIVMIGVASFSSSMKSLQTLTSRSSILTTQTSVAMNHIRRNAEQAIGSSDDPGIQLQDSGNPLYFSFRQDNNNPPTVEDTSDDRWVIYTNGGVVERWYVCFQNEAGTNDFIPRTASGQECDPANNITLLNNVSDITYDFVTDASEAQMDLYFEISITTIGDTGQSADPFKNPEVTMQTRINPKSHSW